LRSAKEASDKCAGNRSRFIDEAVRYFVRGRSRTQLRKLLEEGSQRSAARDLAIAEEWFHVDEEADTS
jgi:CopG family transcriptional regulator/antitoxin EndoAI